LGVHRLTVAQFVKEMLLYGSQYWRKTFFAERFAEEADYNFIKVIASDLASIYIHGTQEKIGKIFDEAHTIHFEKKC
jgi:SpoVK/Ycf46/Vps4 family AAA+-type ATPase